MESKRSHKGTDNVLVDLGFEDAEELTAKASLAVKLNELVERRGLSQTEVAAITGMTQPKVSQVRRYKLQNISLERLMQALAEWGRSLPKAGVEDSVVVLADGKETGRIGPVWPMPNDGKLTIRVKGNAPAVVIAAVVRGG